MTIWLIIGAGGALGAMLRHAVNMLVHRFMLTATFPYGILTINVIGSAVIGVLAGMIASGRIHLTYEMRTFVIVGLLGGFTTFSSFSLDTLTLARTGHWAMAMLNVASHFGVGLLAVVFGFRIGHGPN